MPISLQRLKKGGTHQTFKGFGSAALFEEPTYLSSLNVAAREAFQKVMLRGHVSRDAGERCAQAIFAPPDRLGSVARRGEKHWCGNTVCH